MPSTCRSPSLPSHYANRPNVSTPPPALHASFSGQSSRAVKEGLKPRNLHDSFGGSYFSEVSPPVVPSRPAIGLGLGLALKQSASGSGGGLRLISGLWHPPPSLIWQVTETKKAANLRLVRAFGKLQNIELSRDNCTFYCRSIRSELRTGVGIASYGHRAALMHLFVSAFSLYALLTPVPLDQRCHERWPCTA